MYFEPPVLLMRGFANHLVPVHLKSDPQMPYTGGFPVISSSRYSVHSSLWCLRSSVVPLVFREGQEHPLLVDSSGLRQRAVQHSTVHCLRLSNTRRNELRNDGAIAVFKFAS